MAVIITLVVFILLILVIIWGHYLSQVKKDDIDQDSRDHTNKTLYHEHKAEIESDFLQEKIDQENYQYLVTELDKSFLQDMEENQAHSKISKTKQQISVVWPSVISIFVLVFSVAVYQKIGAFEQLSQPQIQQDQHGNLAPEQQESINRIEQLKAQLSATPDNSELWYAFGQELVALGSFENAMTAFDKAIEIEGVVADLVGAKAQAAYYKNEQKLTPEVNTLIEQALALDPTDASTNILLGMHAFSETNYQAAIDYWQIVLDANKSVNTVAITQAINEAKSRLTQNTATPQQEQATSVGEQAVGLTVNVTISTEIHNKLIEQSDKTVFIYAIPADGPRMPVAAVKMMASDLPTRIVLDDSRAMNPQMKISNFEQVNLFAVISQQGTPGIKPGDYQGQLNNIAVSERETINIVIDTLVE